LGTRRRLRPITAIAGAGITDGGLVAGDTAPAIEGAVGTLGSASTRNHPQVPETNGDEWYCLAAF